MRDFGTIHRVSIHRASLVPRYNRVSKKRDILDSTYAVVTYTDRHACFIAVRNLDNTIRHPITNQFYSVVENVKMGEMVVRRSLRIRQHILNFGNRA